MSGRAHGVGGKGSCCLSQHPWEEMRLRLATLVPVPRKGVRWNHLEGADCRVLLARGKRQGHAGEVEAEGAPGCRGFPVLG